jgi:hypothetical protein
LPALSVGTVERCLHFARGFGRGRRASALCDIHEILGAAQERGQIMEEVSSQNSRREEFLDELQSELSDPLHRRLIQVYWGDDPVQSMESELAKILLEVLRRED